MFMQIDADAIARVVQTTRTPFKDYRSYLILLLILLLRLKLYKTSVHLKYTQNTNQNIIIAVSFEHQVYTNVLSGSLWKFVIITFTVRQYDILKTFLVFESLTRLHRVHVLHSDRLHVSEVPKLLLI